MISLRRPSSSEILGTSQTHSTSSAWVMREHDLGLGCSTCGGTGREGRANAVRNKSRM